MVLATCAVPVLAQCSEILNFKASRQKKMFTDTNTNTNNFILDIKYGAISVTIIYINKHDSRLNPGNRYKDICRGTSVIVMLQGQ